MCVSPKQCTSIVAQNAEERNKGRLTLDIFFYAFCGRHIKVLDCCGCVTLLYDGGASGGE